MAGRGEQGAARGDGRGPRRPLGASQINITVSFYEQQSLLLIAALMASALSRRARGSMGERGREGGRERDEWEVASISALGYWCCFRFVCLAKV